MASFEAAVTLQAAPDAVFEMLTRPVNFPKLGPPSLKWDFLDAPDVLERGSRIEVEVGGFGMMQRVLHEILELERPVRFLGRQLRGPLKHCVHEHFVEGDGAGGVRLIDRIEFEPPGGLTGVLLTERRIRGLLKSGVDYYHQSLKRLLEEL